MTLEFLTPMANDASAAVAAGNVFVIRCEPDPFTGERINIGVCVQEAGGKRHVSIQHAANVHRFLHLEILRKTVALNQVLQ